MIDIEFIRNNPELVQSNAQHKGYSIDVNALIQSDLERRQLQGKVDEIRRLRNELNDQISGKPTEEQQVQGRAYKEEVASLDERLKQADTTFLLALRAVPNMSLEAVPLGVTEADNVIIKTVGTPPQFAFPVESHHIIGEERGLIDKTRAAKISGSRFAYLKGELVQLQFAILSFVMTELSNSEVIAKIVKDNDLKVNTKAFVPVLPPAMLKTEPYQASSRLNAEEVTYKIEQDDLWLNASAEHTLCTMYMGEVIAEKDLPIRMLGYSTSFRREAGTYGKDMEGILRLHQFDKLEMEVLSTAATGLEEHKLLVAIQEYLLNKIGLPYQVLEKCTADIGKPNAKGVDINTWFPSQNTFRETHTADFMTDYQARDLKIRARLGSGQLEFINTNDATAFAMGRIMAAIIENYQTENKEIIIPEALRPFMGGRERI